MRKIEKMMVAAVNEGRNWTDANTAVIVTRTGIFVRLYDTLIYGKVRGREYYSDGGYKTATTGSRLRALGAAYSTNEKLNACKLTGQQDMELLFQFGQTAAERAKMLRRICSEHDTKAAPIVVNM